jgi:hypothetical protein
MQDIYLLVQIKKWKNDGHVLDSHIVNFDALIMKLGEIAGIMDMDLKCNDA